MAEETLLYYLIANQYLSTQENVICITDSLAGLIEDTRAMNLITIMTFLLNAVSPSQNTPAILAVFDLEAKGIEMSGDLLQRMNDLLVNQLVSSRVFQVIPREQVKQQLLEKKKESYLNCYERSCQLEIGRELAANKLLSAQILRLGSRCTLALNLYDLRKATNEKAASVEAECSEDALATAVRNAVSQLAGQNPRPIAKIVAPPPAAQKKPKTLPVLSARSPGKARPYSRGPIYQLDLSVGFGTIGTSRSPFDRDSSFDQGLAGALSAGYRFRYWSAEAILMFAIGRDRTQDALSTREEIYYSIPLLVGITGRIPVFGSMELQAGAHSGFAMYETADPGSDGAFAMRAHLGLQKPFGPVAVGVQLAYLYCFDSWHLITTSLTFNLTR